MVELSRAALFGKLHVVAYRAIESGAALGRAAGHARVELSHWLHQVFQLGDSDLHGMARFAGLDPAAIANELQCAVERLPRHPYRPIDLSSDVLDAAERGWIHASLQYGARQVRTGHVLVGIVANGPLQRALMACTPTLGRLDESICARAFEAIASVSPEASSANDAVSPPRDAMGNGSDTQRSPGALGRFTVDLTALAREGKLDSIVGRQAEIRQIIDILLRRRQNNPLLTGDAGVGKTAVVEGLARRIVANEVPARLRDVSVRTLDLGLLQAGAGAKGEFEARLRQVVDEAQAAVPAVILFVDEAHTLVGAGGAAGTGDAANLLKPALARGALRMIAATTWDEYKRHIEKDPALARRFQPVSIGEPDEAQALAMLRAISPAMEAHHKVEILDEALLTAVALSHRYINDRQLPDKAVSLLDTVCARVAAGREAVPTPLDEARERAATLAAEYAVLSREHALGRGDLTQVRRARDALAAASKQAEALERQWRMQAKAVDDVLSLRGAMRDTGAALGEASPLTDAAGAMTAGANAATATTDAVDDRRAALVRRECELSQLQGESPLVLAQVDRQAVAGVVQDWTGIPVRRMLRDEVDNVLALAERLNERIVGQQHATQRIARCVRTARAGLHRHERPLGVFLLAGPSGVGKTETAHALAEALHGGERHLLTFNMSEYREPHTVSTLKGAPPGYVGYGEGGTLTEAVRRKPYCVLLLDEIEKAHRDVHALFYQVFDKGWMEDGQGRVVDFRNTLIVLTTNVGDDCISQAWAATDSDEASALDTVSAPLRQALLTVFPAALLARMTTIPYLPLSDASMRSIVRAQLERVRRRVQADYAAAFEFDDRVVAAILDRCSGRESGARFVDSVIGEAILPEVGLALLSHRDRAEPIARVELRAEGDTFHCDIAR